MVGKVPVLAVLCDHVEVEGSLESEVKLQDVGVTVLHMGREHLHDMGLTHCILELLVLHEVLLFHCLHSHNDAAVLVADLEHSAEGALADHLKDVEIVEYRLIELSLLEEPQVGIMQWDFELCT